jgi:hypothetical protein
VHSLISMIGETAATPTSAAGAQGPYSPASFSARFPPSE